MNGLVMTLEEDKRFSSVWLLYYGYFVSNIADSRMEVPRYRFSPSSWDFFLSVFSSSEVLGKTSELWSADCLLVSERKERKVWSRPTCFMSKATSVTQTNHSQYSSTVEALKSIVESKSLPVELDNSTKGHCRNVRGLGKSMVVFRLFEKLRCSNERSSKFESLYHE